MTASEILQEVRAKMPYWWRVHLRDGRSFDIRYPGLMLVTQPLHISERDPEDEGDDWPLAGKSHFIEAEEIVRLEALVQPRQSAMERIAMGKIDIETYLKAEPFRPFGLLLSNGKRFEINHPEFASLSRTAITIARPPQSENADTAYRPLTLSLFHVIEVEKLTDA